MIIKGIKKIKTKKVLLSWIISYVVVLIMPIIICLLGCIKFIKINNERSYDAQNAVYFIILYIMICLLSGGFITGYIISRNYKALRNVIRLIENSQGENEDIVCNELTFVENSILKLLEEKKNLNRSLNQQKEVMRNNFLTRLMKGSISDVSIIMDTCKIYDIHELNGDFLIMILRIDNIFSTNKHFDPGLAIFIVRNIIEELLSDKFLGFTAEVDGMICCLVNIRNDDKEEFRYKDIKEEINSIALKIIEFLDKNFSFTLSVAVSGRHSTVLGTTEAFSEAMKVMEYKILIDEVNPVVYYDTIISRSVTSGTEASEIFNKERQFINCIEAKDYKRAEAIIKDIILNDIPKSTYSLQIVKCRIFGLLHLMFNRIDEIKIATDAKVFDDVGAVKRLLDSKTLPEIQKQVNYIFNKIGDYYNSVSFNNSIHDKNDQILEYVKINFTDSGISISMLADKFETNISSLSRSFKKNMGIGLLDYIHKLRLEKAKELIKSTEMNIKDIAVAVGYYNNLAMLRSFKRYEGITPSRFRDIRDLNSVL